MRELVQLSAKQLLRIPNLGRGTLAHIAEVLHASGFGHGMMNDRSARKLEAQKTVLDGIKAAGKPIISDDIVDAPIGVLPFNVRAKNSLAKVGVLRIRELVQLSDEELLRIPNFGRRTLRHLVCVLQKSMSESGVIGVNDVPQEIKNWRQAIDALPVSSRAWTVLDQRFGVDRRLTLREISKRVGVTRERVRQIQNQAVDLLGRAPCLAAGLDRIEKLISSGDGKIFEGVRTPAEFVSAVQGISDVAVSYEDGIRLLVVVRALTNSGIGEKLWRRLSYSASVLSPPVEKHSEVRRLLVESARKRRERIRQWTYRDLILHVLREEQEPLHWREIAERCESLGRRRAFSASTCFNQMLDRRFFVRVGQGRYGLTEWGLERSQNISDLVASFLFEGGECLSYGEILHRSDAMQKVKTQSVKMTLDLHPRFYRAINGKYGLRAWLPTRERQTLRTRKDLIEADDSSRRVSRAEARGYDVSRIVLGDVKALAAPTSGSGRRDKRGNDR